MINLEKMGKFLRKNREKLNLSQTELGRKIYVTRQAVSQWELGKNFPDLQSAIALAKLYNVNIGDIYAGEILSDKNKYNSIIEFVIKSEMKRIRKIITMLVISLFVILLLFLSYYFISVYNKISIYTINTIEEPYQINGIITKSVNDVYVNFELNKEVNNLCLIYNDTKLNCIKNTNYLVIKETIGNNEQLPELSKISINKFINNLYIEIDNETKIKLNIVHDYKNDKLVFSEESENSDYEDKYIINNSIPKKVLETFKYIKEENIYKLTTNNIEIKYAIDNNVIITKIANKSKTNYYSYDISNDVLYEYTTIDSNNVSKKLKNDEISKEIKKYFKEEILYKYVY
ncbi:MAG: helix-turn-helix domain-containing protein [Firmicutes bacterium]|nr:helix-turn-helix domain-containing protein [Bacillota bacterium]